MIGDTGVQVDTLSHSMGVRKVASDAQVVVPWNGKKVCVENVQTVQEKHVMSLFPEDIQGLLLRYYSGKPSDFTALRKELGLNPTVRILKELFYNNNPFVLAILEEAEWDVDAINDSYLKQGVLSVISSSKKLDISGLCCTYQKIQRIVKYFPYVQNLQMACCDVTTPKSFTELVAVKGLKSLIVSGTLTSAHFAELTRIERLESLTLTGCNQLRDDHCAYLAKMQSLTALDLSWCSELTDNCCKELVKLRSLTHLHLSGCDRITDEGRSFLADQLPLGKPLSHREQ